MKLHTLPKLAILFPIHFLTYFPEPSTTSLPFQTLPTSRHPRGSPSIEISSIRTTQIRILRSQHSSSAGTAAAGRAGFLVQPQIFFFEHRKAPGYPEKELENIDQRSSRSCSLASSQNRPLRSGLPSSEPPRHSTGSPAPANLGEFTTG